MTFRTSDHELCNSVVHTVEAGVYTEFLGHGLNQSLMPDCPGTTNFLLWSRAVFTYNALTYTSSAYVVGW
jgi:hypothetical protein